MDTAERPRWCSLSKTHTIDPGLVVEGISRGKSFFVLSRDLGTDVVSLIEVAEESGFPFAKVKAEKARRQLVYLRTLEETKSKTKALRAAGVSRQLVHMWRNADPVFQEREAKAAQTEEGAKA